MNNNALNATLAVSLGAAPALGAESAAAKGTPAEKERR